MVVLWERVEGSMVLEPILTTLWPLLPVSVRTAPLEVADASVDVAMWEVRVEPSELVVVTAMVVGTDVLCCELCCDADDAAEEAPSVEEVSAVLLAGVVAGVLVPGVLVLPALLVGVVVVGDTACDVLGVDVGVGVSLVDTPVPTTALFGMTPSGISSALICAKAMRKESMTNRDAGVVNIELVVTGRALGVAKSLSSRLCSLLVRICS